MMGSGMMGRGMMGPGMMVRPPVEQSNPAAGGAEIFQKQCAMCHVLRAGARSTVGPNLHGVFGRKSGSLPGYPYSTAMRNADFVWNGRTLDHFIAAPQSFVHGTTMAFPGIADDKARRKLIAYLRTATK